MPRQFETHSGEETRALGRTLSQLLPRNGVALLIGELGAGKTTLAKGIIEGLGAADGDDVSSPTYTLIHEYGSPVRVYHVDLYRLDTAAQVRALGFDELIEQDALILIEWGERFPELLPGKRIEIRLHAAGETTRTIRVDGLDSSGHLPR